jgi:acyl-CoA thioester hydrolase
MIRHGIDIRIYYEDTDFSGLVYHANYLKFFERGRTEALRAAGLSNRLLMESDDPLVFAVYHMDIRFAAPARMDDLIRIETTIAEARGARVIFEQVASRDATPLVSAKVTVATMTPNGRPRRVPDGVMTAFRRISASGA